MAGKNRATYTSEFKASVLAELSQATPAEVAAKHSMNVSNIHNWMKQAGMKSARAKRRQREQPTERQTVALQAMANRGDKTLKQLASELQTTPKTLRELVKYFGLPKPSNGVTYGAHHGAHPGVLAVSNGAAVNPLLALTEAKRQLSGIITQLDALTGAFQAFQAVFGVVPVPTSASVSQ